MDIFTMIMACSLYPENAIINAIVQTGSREKSLIVTTVASDGVRVTKDTFKTPTEAALYAKTAIHQGDEVSVGIMQLPYRWLSQYTGRASLEELFRPCKNMVIATDALNKAMQYCRGQGKEDDTACALSVYKTDDMQKGAAYAETIIQYASANPMKNNPQYSPPKPPMELPEPSFNEY